MNRTLIIMGALALAGCSINNSPIVGIGRGGGDAPTPTPTPTPPAAVVVYIIHGTADAGEVTMPAVRALTPPTPSPELTAIPPAQVIIVPDGATVAAAPTPELTIPALPVETGEEDTGACPDEEDLRELLEGKMALDGVQYCANVPDAGSMIADAYIADRGIVLVNETRKKEQVVFPRMAGLKTIVYSAQALKLEVGGYTHAIQDAMSQ